MSFVGQTSQLYNSLNSLAASDIKLFRLSVVTENKTTTFLEYKMKLYLLIVKQDIVTPMGVHHEMSNQMLQQKLCPLYV